MYRAGVGGSPDVVVVGAGAAGIFAAWRAASLGARVLLLEKTARIGTKILISGGGKCNLTHDGTVEDVLRGFRREEARFLRPSMYRFTNADVVEMLEARGLATMVRPDGRVFPAEGNAKDVVRILRGYLDEAGVEVRLACPVVGLTRPLGVALSEGSITCGRVVVAVGGSSYPNSGTTGDGWEWARAAGHSVVPPRAALAPIDLVAAHPEWSGVALRDCVLKGRQGKEFVRWRGDLLFTHSGVSGPCALGISREVAEAAGAVNLEADLAPDLSFEEVSSRLRAELRRRTAAHLEGMMPQRLVAAAMGMAEVPLETVGARLDRKGRNRLVEVLKGWPLGTVRYVPLVRGEVVAGGVSLAEVEPQTMESRVVPGLFWCGEALDVAGAVGGYNLQAAWSTGFVAGEAAVRALKG